MAESATPGRNTITRAVATVATAAPTSSPRRSGVPGVQPAADRLGHPVDQVVEPGLGQRLGVRAQMEHRAVGETGPGQGGLLVERGVAEPLEHPAGVVEPGLLGLLTDVPQEGGEQIGDRYVARARPDRW